METKKKKKIKTPHVLVIFSILMVIIAILTYIIPAGQFDTRVDEVSGRTVYISGTYHRIESNPTTIGGFLSSLIRGLETNADVIFFVILISASFQIITGTGLIDKMAYGAGRKFSGSKAYVIIPIFACLFATFSTTMGMSQELILFIPLGVAVARSLGFDSVVGNAMIVLGAYVGYTCGLVNPFNTGVAQTIAEVPLYSDIAFRAVMVIILLTVTILYIIRYAKKVKADPKASLVYNEDQTAAEDFDMDSVEKMKPTDWVMVLVLIGGLAFLIYGVAKLDWWFEEMSALFFAIGLICGIISRMGVDELIKQFIKGAEAVTTAVLILGFAGAVTVLMTDAGIIDTIVNAAANMVQGFPPALSAVGMFFMQTIINLPIISGTAQAAVTMPLMVPIGDLVGVSREVTVQAFCFGDGFTNVIYPTSGTVLTCLAIAGIPYGKWFKWALKLVLIWSAIAIVALIISSNFLYPA